MTEPARAPLELWGGLECSIVRVGDDYRDQFRDTGHYGRIEDLDRIAALGIRTLRYPVLWEAVSPESPDEADFSWHDERIETLRTLGIEPIIGLLHHGSGPGYTNLLDPNFPKLFAAHAARVAQRYPHLRHYTPVNEPLTTARFSALYGFWYPHRSDIEGFARALINQCNATRLAMQAIRAVNPDARLVQTEDMGKTFGTPALKYQCDYENERRWLSFDLLFGRVTPDHPLYRHLLDCGIGAKELDELSSDAVPPDVIGINYYLTSERYLEHRPRHCPESHPMGGNGRHRYADLEAVRVSPPPQDMGVEFRLREVWERYRTPMAVTEAHLGCSRDEQLRWLSEIWRTSMRLRQEGADIRAVTIWSMFGSMDWSSLLQRRNGHYEPGAFDALQPVPQQTALASACEAICRDGDFDHPVLDTPGWWHRPDRFYKPRRHVRPEAAPERRALLVGLPSDPLTALEKTLQRRGLAYVTLNPADLSPAALAEKAAVNRHPPVWTVVVVSEGHQPRHVDAARKIASDNALPLLHFETDTHVCRVFTPSGGSGRSGKRSARPTASGASFQAGLKCETEMQGACIEDLLHPGLDLLLDRGGTSSRRKVPAYRYKAGVQSGYREAWT